MFFKMTVINIELCSFLVMNFKDAQTYILLFDFVDIFNNKEILSNKNLPL